MNLVQETRVFSNALDRLPLPAGVSHAYNPLAYMRRAHERYLERFVPCMYEQVAPQTTLTTAPSPRPYLILGMNPGPWGMVQTGVPFGDVTTARSLLLTHPSPLATRSAEQWAEMAQSTMKAAGVLPGRFS